MAFQSVVSVVSRQGTHNAATTKILSGGYTGNQNTKVTKTKK